jgi:hypothetical protein
LSCWWWCHRSTCIINRQRSPFSPIRLLKPFPFIFSMCHARPFFIFWHNMYHFWYPRTISDDATGQPAT